MHEGTYDPTLLFVTSLYTRVACTDCHGESAVYERSLSNRVACSCKPVVAVVCSTNEHVFCENARYFLYRIVK